MAEAFEVKAVAKHIQISPQKVRLVVDVVRGKDAEEALDILRFMPQKAAEPVFKLIQSAVANAEQNFGLEMDELYVSKIYADEGPRRRLSPYGGRFGARGRFKPILRRSSHITVVLAEREVVDYY
ncbi:MAG: 50S ribosomal protein L22 [Phycisphaerae bacterium]|nr:50S ribosomal protein L22 [Phycisphaerae bacterium]NIP50379.1 50S ribosomal protein L22 [Phycisphaerae bacterium]NIU99717.1 50S ribosomal protein L22 [Phycisphaerae bacterium]NIW16806.1 50S ribosomal protein L22 [candidate division KSB1 bacterium]NIX26036.1 50S ribosomal protein L22 [Phycisphaerae bacterium]